MGLESYFKKHWIKIVTVGGFLIALLAWFGIKPESFISFFTSFFNRLFIQSPDYKFRILIVIILIWLIFLAPKIIKILRANIPKLRDDFEKHKEINSIVEEEIRENLTTIRTDLNYVYNRYKKYEKLEPDKEIRFVLKLVANQSGEKQKKSEIEKRYFSAYKNKEQFNFNSVFNLNASKDFLEQERGSTGYGGSYAELPYKITNKGYAYLRYREIDDQENKKGD